MLTNIDLKVDNRNDTSDSQNYNYYYTLYTTLNFIEKNYSFNFLFSVQLPENKEFSTEIFLKDFLSVNSIDLIFWKITPPEKDFNLGNSPSVLILSLLISSEDKELLSKLNLFWKNYLNNNIPTKQFLEKELTDIHDFTKYLGIFRL